MQFQQNANENVNLPRSKSLFPFLEKAEGSRAVCGLDFDR